MDNKITRRAVLGTAVVLGVSGNVFLLRKFLSSPIDQGRGQGMQGKRSISSYFEETLMPTMPDISQYERDFETIVSLAPLLPNRRKVKKVLYDISSTQEVLLTRGKKIFQKAEEQPVPQSVTCEIEYLNNDHKSYKGSQIIDIVQRMHNVAFPDELKRVAEAPYKLTVDGQRISQEQSIFSPKEISPKYLSTPVMRGAKWTQTLSVDDKLNPGGNVQVQFEVLATYAKGEEKFVRIKQEVTYSSYQPEFDPKTKIPSLKKVSKDTMRTRQVACLDFSIEKGFSVHESTINITFMDHVPFGDPQYGVLTIAKPIWTLKSYA